MRQVAYLEILHIVEYPSISFAGLNLRIKQARVKIEIEVLPIDTLAPHLHYLHFSPAPHIML